MGSMSILKKLFYLYKPFHKKIFILAVILLAVNAVGLAVPYFFGRIVLSITENGVTREVWQPVLLALIASLVALGLRYVQILYEELNIDHDIPEYLRRKTVRKVDELSVNQLMNENSGRLQSVAFTGEGATLNLFMNVFIFSILPIVTTLSVTIGFIIFIDWRIALWLLLGLCMTFYTLYSFQKHFTDKLKRLEEERHDRNTFISEIFRNFVVIKLFGSSKKVIRRFMDISGRYLGNSKEIFGTLVSQHTIRGIFFDIISFGAIVISIWGISEGRYDIAIFVALFGWIQGATGSMRNIYWILRRITENTPKVEKYFEFLETEPDITFGKHKVKHIEGAIEFKNVAYTYENKRFLTKDDKSNSKQRNIEKPSQALKGATFSIAPGETVALVGPSGAGKSTIVQMILGAYIPHKGDVLIDNVSLAEHDIDHLRQFIGYVPQQIDPLDDTIQANIEIGLPYGKNAQKKEIDEVVKISALTDVINRAPQGLKTTIGEKGIKLSGGERQRLGIARALIRNPRILIFDEATSSLDTKNERLITEAIEKITKDRTTIIIAHRLATVAHADKIIFVKDGKVVAEGNHQELLEKSSDYRELVEHQLVLG